MRGNVISAVSALIKRRNEYLLVKRGNAIGKGLWSLPGGKVEYGETSFSACLREIEEEVPTLPLNTVNFSDKQPFHVSDIIANDFNTHYVILCWFGEIIDEDMTIPLQAGSDAVEASFFPIEQIEDLLREGKATEGVDTVITTSQFRYS
eukprot:g213.t1